ncbi:MAG TPA: hypothetical protein V6C69_02825 [Trichormus sp.]
MSLWLVTGLLVSQSARANSDPALNTDHWAGATITYITNSYGTANNGTDQVQPQSQQIDTPAQTEPTKVAHLASTTLTKAAADPLFDCKDGVTADFIAEISQDATQLPAAWKQKLTKAGYRIVVSRTLFDSVPSARGQQVRGYKRSATWSQIFGLFDRRHRRVVMAQLARQTEDEKSQLITLNDQQTRAGILRHEFGHAIDDYASYPSHSRAFARAYAVGLPRLRVQDKLALKYYLQAGFAGKEEMFAELFAIKGGAACDPIADIVLKQKFPEAAAVVNSTIRNTSGA